MNEDPIVFLLVEDSEHDILVFRRAWQENGIANELQVVRGGQDCLDYLHHRGRYRREEDAPRPKIILLNNRMPRIEGLKVLNEIRQNEALEIYSGHYFHVGRKRPERNPELRSGGQRLCG